MILLSYRSLYPATVRSPHLPPKPPPPWPDKSHQGPQRRGTQTSPAAFDRNSYPFQQGPDDEVDDPPQTGPTRDPRRTAVLSLLPPILLPNPTSSLHSGSRSSQSTPSTPALPQFFQGVHPSRLARSGTDAFDAAFNNSESPVVANPTPEPSRSLSTCPTSMSRSESAVLIPTGMHPDRIALLSAHDRPPPTNTSTQLPPHASDDDLQLPLTWGRRPTKLAERSSSFLLGNYFPIIPRDGPIPSSSRVTLDGVAASTTSGLLLPGSFVTTPNSGNPPTSAESHNHPDPSPNRSKKGKKGKKRKASGPHPSNPNKLPKFPKGKKRKRVRDKNTGGPGGAKAWGGGGSRKKRVKATDQPGPSGAYYEKSSVEREGDWEDGEW